MWPAVKSRITWSSIVTRLQRMAQSSGPSSIPWAAASSGARPVKYSMRVVAQQAQSWPRPTRAAGGAGTLLARPTTPAAATASIAGTWAASQRRLAAERLLRLVGTAVGNDDCVFH